MGQELPVPRRRFLQSAAGMTAIGVSTAAGKPGKENGRGSGKGKGKGRGRTEISGKVVDRRGSPVADAEVRVFARKPQKDPDDPATFLVDSVAEATTSSDDSDKGQFTISLTGKRAQKENYGGKGDYNIQGSRTIRDFLVYSFKSPRTGQRGTGTARGPGSSTEGDDPYWFGGEGFTAERLFSDTTSTEITLDRKRVYAASTEVETQSNNRTYTRQVDVTVWRKLPLGSAITQRLLAEVRLAGEYTVEGKQRDKNRRVADYNVPKLGDGVLTFQLPETVSVDYDRGGRQLFNVKGELAPRWADPRETKDERGFRYKQTFSLARQLNDIGNLTVPVYPAMERSAFGILDGEDRNDIERSRERSRALGEAAVSAGLLLTGAGGTALATASTAVGLLLDISKLANAIGENDTDSKYLLGDMEAIDDPNDYDRVKTNWVGGSNVFPEGDKEVSFVRGAPVATVHDVPIGVSKEDGPFQASITGLFNSKEGSDQQIGLNHGFTVDPAVTTPSDDGL